MNSYEKKHLAKLREANAECTLFLERDEAFPIENACDVALYGNGARQTVKGGTGSGEVNSRFSTTVEQGLIDAGFNIKTKDWLDKYDKVRIDAKKQFVKRVKAEAKAKNADPIWDSMGKIMPEPEYYIPLRKECDLAVYVLARISGEGSDRKFEKGDVLLSNSEIRDILKLSKHYEKFLLVLNVGGPVDLSPVAGKVKNILLLSQLGVETGAILADIILGKANPSGKLATTWADADKYSTIGDFGEYEETHYNEGVYVGYRYFESAGVKARYPFGYGLSYTTMDTTAVETIVNKTNITVKAKVTNTGKYAGKEVVMVYYSCPDGKLDKPRKQLAAFAKTKCLEPGDSEVVEVSFDASSMAAFDTENAEYILEAGDYVLRIGNRVDELKAAAIVSLDKTVITRKVKSTGDKPEFTDYVPELKCGIKPPVNTVRVELKAADFETEVVKYNPEYEIDPILKTLTDEELCYMNIGGFIPNAGIAAIIGNAAFSVAGAAGETALALKDKGIGSAVMADGPAGVRIAKKYYVDEQGVHPVGMGIPETMMDFLPFYAKMFIKFKTKPKRGVKIKTQYATAIPIGTAIAQSFNTEYAKMCGDIVGAEMEHFKIRLWLAPALNIHRSILCGRNFEYYSEDPLVSGQMAAAITLGVQKHPGCAVTIKHYAGNNQETNRYNSNSHISERALREIYLKGFEICVKESAPKAVMTSYNLINGVHTSERRDLTEDLLRAEFGFDGIVMTDWIAGGEAVYNSKKYPIPHPARVANAGGDLYMPGGQKDYDDLLAALKAGEITREQLEINATRVLKAINDK